METNKYRLVYSYLKIHKKLSNLLGCIFFAFKIHQIGPLNKIDWRKVEFYSSVITTIILVICGLSAFILSLQWKGYDRGYGQLSKLHYFISR